MDKLKLELEEIFNKYLEVEKVMLFGSRARGDNKYNSDVDLCIFGEDLTHLTLAKINMDINEINTYLSFDILAFNELGKEGLINNIIREGVVIYNGKKVG
ncbi:MAG: nucleotidyltransferase domain-containing protein [Clostridiaceae bacterium]